jgi:hypothetical protein
MSTEIIERRPNRSEQIAELVTALSKAQGQIENANKSSDNPFFKSKYADLASVWDACRQPLSSNGLAIIQTIDDAIEDGRVCVETLLAHSSGQWISHRIRLKPVKDDAQAIGSAITYARRYGLQSLVGIAPEDDDGNAASGKHGNGQEANKVDNKSRQSTTIAPPSEPVRQNGDYISEAQLKRFHAITREHKWLDDEAKKLLAEFGVLSSKYILKKDYERICRIVETSDYTAYLDTKNNPPA